MPKKDRLKLCLSTCLLACVYPRIYLAFALCFVLTCFSLSENQAYKLLVGLSFHFPFTLLNTRFSLVGIECGFLCKIQASLFFSLCTSVYTPPVFFEEACMPKSKVAVITTSGKSKVCLFRSCLPSFFLCIPIFQKKRKTEWAWPEPLSHACSFFHHHDTICLCIHLFSLLCVQKVKSLFAFLLLQPLLPLTY